MTVTDFQGREPEMRIETYFAGPTEGAGIVRDRFGNLRRQFTVTMTGRWEGDVFVLEEDFVYDDGETDHRTWRVHREGVDGYRATAPDVIGEAVGKTSGNALNWRYTLALPIGGRTWHIDFDDWMFLQPGGVLINQAYMSKFGIRIGEIVLSFRKPAAAASDSISGPARTAALP
jgi:hypothetical protein